MMAIIGNRIIDLYLYISNLSREGICNIVVFHCKIRVIYSFSICKIVVIYCYIYMYFVYIIVVFYDNMLVI